MLLAVPRYRHGRLVDRLGEIGKLTKFEVAFGKNGIIWVNSANHRTTVLLYNIFSQVLQGCK